MLSEPRERSNWFDWEDEGGETQLTFKESMEDCQEETKVKGSLGKRKNTGQSSENSKILRKSRTVWAEGMQVKSWLN